MPFTYSGMFADPIAAGPDVRDVTPKTIAPLLVLWLFVTTNPDFFSNDSTKPSQLKQKDKQDIADQLGLTFATVQKVITDVQSSPKHNSFVDVARAFSAIGSGGNYGTSLCPSTPQEVLVLAKCAAVPAAGQLQAPQK